MLIRLLTALKCKWMGLMKTDSESVMAAFKRLSAAALGSGGGEDCQVNRNDLSTILMAYQLELINRDKQESEQ